MYIFIFSFIIHVIKYLLYILYVFKIYYFGFLYNHLLLKVAKHEFKVGLFVFFHQEIQLVQEVFNNLLY